jgi:hypothetical protein
METSTIILNGLFLLAFILLITVSGGVLYLTSIEWRDRRRRDREKRTKNNK